jgi:hypothetical protein
MQIKLLTKKLLTIAEGGNELEKTYEQRIVNN